MDRIERILPEVDCQGPPSMTTLVRGQERGQAPVAAPTHPYHQQQQQQQYQQQQQQQYQQQQPFLDLEQAQQQQQQQQQQPLQQRTVLIHAAGSAAFSDDASGRSSPVQQQQGLAFRRSRTMAGGGSSLDSPGGGAGAARRVSRAAGGAPLERSHGDHDDPDAPYPLPRFPVAHTSAAFDAVAARRSLILTPAEVYAECAHHGVEKAAFGAVKLAALSVVAGCYVAFSFTICLAVGGNIGADLYRDRPGLFALVFGAVGFPAGFTMITVLGGELFTSMSAYSAAAWYEGRVRLRDCARLLAVTWLGNFAGCALFAGLILATGLFDGKEWYMLALAQKKVHLSFGSAFVRGIFGNWMVGIATFQAVAAQDLTGKAVGIWLPISAFAMLGFEHCIANQYLLPLAIAHGAPIDARRVVASNLVPATLGNWVGGAVLVSGTYALAFGLPNKRLTGWLLAARARAADKKRRDDALSPAAAALAADSRRAQQQQGGGEGGGGGSKHGGPSNA